MSTSEQLPLSTGIPETGAGQLRDCSEREGHAPGHSLSSRVGAHGQRDVQRVAGDASAACRQRGGAVLPPNSAFSGNPYAAVPSPTAPAVPGLVARLAIAQPGRLSPRRTEAWRRMSAQRGSCCAGATALPAVGLQRLGIAPRRTSLCISCRMRGHSLLNPLPSRRPSTLLHRPLEMRRPATKALRRFLLRCFTDVQPSSQQLRSLPHLQFPALLALSILRRFRLSPS
jgi:hypothetical protein